MKDQEPNKHEPVVVMRVWPEDTKQTLPRERIRVVGALMVRDGRCFAARRAPHKSLAGLWEFPGGKLETGESGEQALERELREEFGIEARAGRCVMVGVGGGVLLRLHLAHWRSGELALTDHDEAGWFLPHELYALRWPPADEVLLSGVASFVAGLGPGGEVTL
jgi:8-oxo-dGTP diphosphatase